MRMDTALLAADGRALSAEYHTKRLALRRIDAQLAERPLKRDADDPPALFAQVEAQYAAYVAAHQNALAQERSVLERARHDLAAAREVHAKLSAVLPHYREQEKAFEKLTQDGFAGRLMHTDKQRERIEKEQDLKSQEHAIAAAQATIAQSEKRLAQIGADYRRGLQAERAEAAPQAERLREELAKQQHRHGLLELRAPHGGTVKDLATHTPGTVVAPGTILMTIVPVGEKLRAEVWVSNDDIGWVHTAQRAKIKLASFQFQKYGMLRGRRGTGQRRLDRGAQSQHALRQPRRSRSPGRRARLPHAHRPRAAAARERRPALHPRARHAGDRRDPSRRAQRARVPALAGAQGVPRGRARTLAAGGGLTAMAQYNPPDPAKIDADNPEALRFWARTLETKEDKIRQAVRKVGPMLDQVKMELGIGGVG